MLKEIGCDFTTSTARNAQQNGVAERTNRTLVELGRTILIHSELPKTLWAEAVNFSCQILNATTINEKLNISAYEIFYGQKPYYASFHEFGTKCFCLDQNPQRKKFDPKSFPGILVGLPELSFGYRVWLPNTKKIITTRNVKFLDRSPLEGNGESKNPVKEASPPLQSSSTVPSSMVESDRSGSAQETREEELPVEQEPEHSEGNTMPSADPVASSDDVTVSDEPPRTRPRSRPRKVYQVNPERVASLRESTRRLREARLVSNQNSPSTSKEEDRPKKAQRSRKKNEQDPERIYSLRESTRKRLEKNSPNSKQDTVENETGSEPDEASSYVFTGITMTNDVIEPSTFEEAMASPQKEEWLRAIKEELDHMETMQVWTMVDLPPNKKCIDSKWIFKIKKDQNGNIDRYKCRLVLRGFSQREGKEIYAPVTRWESIRTILNIIAREKLTAYQMDVRCAFLNAELTDYELYMFLPEGLPRDRLNRVCKLNKAIYGAKQSPRLWYKKFRSILSDLGLQQSNADQCIFFGNDQDRIILCLYVDDSIICARNEQVILNFLKKLESKLEITYKPLESFLGLQISRTIKGGVVITQKNYTNEILVRFNMQNCKPISTPLSREIYSDDNTEQIDDTKYREVVGMLLFLSNCTRCDIHSATKR